MDADSELNDNVDAEPKARAHAENAKAGAEWMRSGCGAYAFCRKPHGPNGPNGLQNLTWTT